MDKSKLTNWVKMTSELASDYTKGNDEEKAIMELLIAPLQLSIKTSAMRRMTKGDKANESI